MYSNAQLFLVRSKVLGSKKIICINILVYRIPIKQKGAQSNSRRTCRPTYNYNLQCSSVKYQVCAKMFADTFGVSSRNIGE